MCTVTYTAFHETVLWDHEDKILNETCVINKRWNCKDNLAMYQLSSGFLKISEMKCVYSLSRTRVLPFII